jgi:hypothetical protein
MNIDFIGISSKEDIDEHDEILFLPNNLNDEL